MREKTQQNADTQVHYLVCSCINEPLLQIPGLPIVSLFVYQGRIILDVNRMPV